MNSAKPKITPSSTSVFDCSVLHLPKVSARSGNLTAIEPGLHSPIPIRRIYYLYDVPGGVSRGGHAHRGLSQLIVAASGSFDVILDDGNVRRSFALNRPYHALYIVPGLWRELNNFSSGSVCLVLASDLYDEEDYIRDYGDFCKFKGAAAE